MREQHITMKKPISKKRSNKRADPFYNSPEWKSLRLQRLRMDKWRCQFCGCLCLGAKKGMPAAAVDHIEPIKERPDLKLTLSNTRCLCKPCHDRHTRHSETAKTKPLIGADGYIIEEPAR